MRYLTFLSSNGGVYTEVMVWLLQELIVLGLLAISFQAWGLVKFKKSKVEKPYFWNVAFYILVFEVLIYLLGVAGTQELMVLGLVNVALWLNIVKFTNGLVQEKQIGLYNRLEHFIGGAVIFLGLYLLGIGKLLPLSYRVGWFEPVVIMLVVNLLSVLQEMAEFLVDTVMKREYLVGPGQYDTSRDLLMTLLGSLVGVLIVVVFGL